jgi:hypothetical protein
MREGLALLSGITDGAQASWIQKQMAEMQRWLDHPAER